MNFSFGLYSFIYLSGFGEWEDPKTRTRCRIVPKKPHELASDIYEWAITRGYMNSVCTVYELHSGTFLISIFILFIFIDLISYFSFLVYR